LSEVRVSAAAGVIPGCARWRAGVFGIHSRRAGFVRSAGRIGRIRRARRVGSGRRIRIGIMRRCRMR
jgi:hypothetical protein